MSKMIPNYLALHTNPLVQCTRTVSCAVLYKISARFVKTEFFLLTSNKEMLVKIFKSR